MSKVINCGSLNIDYVYSVSDIGRPGETISAKAFAKYCGGKGANQSVALAKAGAKVLHFGAVGQDGIFLNENLKAAGADTRFISTVPAPTGHAIIQVAENGENSIVLFPGANRELAESDLKKVLEEAEYGDILLLQNETNINAAAIEKAASKGMRICINPAPFDEAVLKLPLAKVNVFIVNETEARGLASAEDESYEKVIAKLAELYPAAIIVMTIGANGALCVSEGRLFRCPCFKVKAIDTTAAGDTFTGYFIAGLLEGRGIEDSLKLASAAASISVSRKGAAISIPQRDEVLKFAQI